MKRRKFLSTAAIGVAGAGLAAPAIAQTAAPVRWRMTTSWPKSMDTLQGACEAIGRRVGELTGGEFEIRVFAGGEIVPPGQVLDAVQNATVECGHTLSSFYIGKRVAYAFDAGLPFGLNMRQQNAWWYYGGGGELIRALFAKDGVVPVPAGNVGVQMGGFYRKEIKTVDDLKGLKFRIGGFGGMILQKLGVVAQQIPAGDIYPSLEKGTIDAAEWIGPYDDEKLGLQKVAKYYYTPGWWEGSAQVTMLINAEKWKALPQRYRDAFEAACAEQMTLMIAKYDAKNPDALRSLIGQGVHLRRFPKPVLDACYKASFETFDELAQKDADFRKIYDQWRKFLVESNAWFQVAEAALDNYRYIARKT